MITTGVLETFERGTDVQVFRANQYGDYGNGTQIIEVVITEIYEKPNPDFQVAR